MSMRIANALKIAVQHNAVWSSVDTTMSNLILSDGSEGGQVHRKSDRVAGSGR